jgi:hypothetical protein
MVFAAAFALGNAASITVSAVLAFVFGYALTRRVVRAAGVPPRRATRLAVASGYYWSPMSVSILNIGKYIEMMMMPTMSPTPIIIRGSTIEVSDWIEVSTSSS